MLAAACGHHAAVGAAMQCNNAVEEPVLCESVLNFVATSGVFAQVAADQQGFQVMTTLVLAP